MGSRDLVINKIKGGIIFFFPVSWCFFKLLRRDWTSSFHARVVLRAFSSAGLVAAHQEILLRDRNIQFVVPCMSNHPKLAVFGQLC